LKTLLSERCRFSDVVEWGRVRHFTEQSWNFANYPINEKWSYRFAKPSPLLVYALDEFRHNLGHPVYISPKNWGVHSTTGRHAAGKASGGMVWAVDIFPVCDLPWAYHIAMKSKFFAGIGVYPFWNWGKLHGGLHLDIRYFETNKKVWWCDAKGKYHYIHSPEELRDFEVTMLTEAV